ncbi:TRAP transporter large permease [Salipiger mucosus]|uniref:TRAP transporter large permease protein n=1 Tax=Salipiger mucosus DSM 16094 TaxID=1123237 RepID=S9RCI5_9RHOB|nr:TRAP transporter large permease [Salipiger mucosus]EPX75840.1 TRAP dicarboxylate transporter, DctM subunit, unknown substrate 8 [Salipiger mucosus DSM 16094]
MGLTPIAIMLGLFLLNVPIALAIAMASLSFFLMGAGLPINAFVQKIAASTESFPLLAVPFFICAGTIMNHAGITRRLLGFADALVGHTVGGLAQSNVVLSALMGGLSASANADAAMQAKMLGSEMVRRGYSPGFTAAVCTCSSVITPIIPPGIGLILYGFLGDVSVGRLFIGGVLPGVVITVTLMLVVRVLARRRNYRPTRAERATPPEVGRAFVEALGALSIIAFILIGIRQGIFTPTEAGAMTVVYASLIGLFWHRELKLSALPAIIRETVLATAVVMLIICAAGAFGFYMTWEQIPSRGAALLLSVTENPLLLLLLINALLLFIGMLIEGTAALILLTPILVPAVTQVGIDPLHFGIVMVVNLTIGGVTPPVGTLMFTSCSILGVSVGTFAREAWPFFVSLLAVLLLLVLVPGIVTFLPDLLMG